MLSTRGSVALVGAGPGGAELITLKGARLLKSADVVVYDRLVGAPVMALIPPGARLIDVGKMSGDHPIPQWEINQILLDEARNGNRVVRLKGGDPFVFGRGGEELELLAQNGVPYEVVPGVTSAISAATYAGIPVTHRDYCSSLHIITGRAKAGEAPDIPFDALAKTGGTLVFLMGVSAIGEICQGLLDAGMEPDMPCAMVQDATLPTQRKITAALADLPRMAQQEGIRSPAVTIVGRVCELNFDWFSDLVLKGCNVLVTRPKAQADTLCSRLGSLGANAKEYPCISMRTIEDNALLRDEIARLGEYEYLALTSAEGVKVLMDQIGDIRALYGVKIAAIGSATAAAIQAYKLKVDYVPEVYDAAHLAEGLSKLATGKVLLCRAREGTPELVRVLSENAVPYTDVPIYDTIYENPNNGRIVKEIAQGKWDYITFTSVSTVKAFMKSTKGADLTKFRALCIGKQTENAAKFCGMTTITPYLSTMDSMIERLVRDYAEKTQAEQNKF